MAKDYTKRKAYYRGVPCWFNPITDELIGRNWLYEIFLQIALWIDDNIVMVDEYPIWIEEDQDFK